MQIIKRGTKNQVECYGCGSVLEFNDNDVHLRKLSRGEYDPDDYPEDRHASYIVCPVCKKQNSVTVRASLKSEILERERQADNDI